MRHDRETVLLIGGSHDGEQLEIFKHENHVVTRARCPFPSEGAEKISPEPPKEHYTRSMFESYSGDTHVREHVHIFRLECMTDMDVMRRLVEQYPKA